MRVDGFRGVDGFHDVKVGLNGFRGVDGLRDDMKVGMNGVHDEKIDMNGFHGFLDDSEKVETNEFRGDAKVWMNGFRGFDGFRHRYRNHLPPNAS
jgi:hypothetical protein